MSLSQRRVGGYLECDMDEWRAFAGRFGAQHPHWKQVDGVAGAFEIEKYAAMIRVALENFETEHVLIELGHCVDVAGSYGAVADRVDFYRQGRSPLYGLTFVPGLPAKGNLGRTKKCRSPLQEVYSNVATRPCPGFAPLSST